MKLRISARLLVKDLRAGELNLLALALCIAVGSVTLIALFADQIQRAMTSESNSFLAADRVISGSMQAPDSFLQAAQELDIDTAQLLGFVSMIYHGQANQLASVKAVSRGYPLRGEMRVNDGSGPRVLASGVGHPKVGEAWIDRLLQARLGLEPGDVIEVGLKPLRVSGIILSEPDPTSGFLDFAPRLTMNWADINATGVVVPGSRLTYRLLLRGEDARLDALREQLRTLMEGRFQWRDVRNSGDRLASVIDRAEGFIMLGGLLAVTLGGVAISLCADRYARRRSSQVAILKTLGAVPLELHVSYAVQFLLIALVATLVGWLLALAGHALLSELMRDALPVALPGTSFEPLLIGALTGVVCLLTFAAPSIRALCGVSPMAVIREDLTQSLSARRTTLFAGGIGILSLMLWYTQSLAITGMTLLGISLSISAFGVLAVLMLRAGRQLGKRSGTALRLALSSLSRHPLLNATHIGVFAMPLCVLFLLLLLQDEVIGEWRQMMPDKAPNHFVLNIADDQVEGVARLLDESSSYQGLVFPMARGVITAVNGEPASSREAEARPDAGRSSERNTPERDEDSADTDEAPDAARGLSRTRNFSSSPRLPEGNELVVGDWWSQPDVLEASLDEEFAGWHGLRLDDQLRIDFNGQLVDVRISSLRKVDWDSFQPNFYLLLSPAALAGIPSTHMASFHVDPDDTSFINRLLDAYPTLSVLSVDQLIRRFRDILDKLSMAMQLLMSLVLASAALVMLASVFSSRELRLREYGLLRTLGGSGRLVRGSLLLEFAALGLFAGIAAALATEATLFVLQTYFFEMPHTWHPLLFLHAPVCGLVLVSLLGVLGTRRMLRVTPVTILREAR